MINLSICVNRGYSAVVILNEGVEVFKDVTKLDTQSREEHYTLQYLKLFSKALFQLQTVVDNYRIPYESECVMEMRCSQVVGWFKNLACPKKHSELFLETLKTFDSLPFRYLLVNNQNPTALYYANEKYIKKEVYSSIYDLG